VPFNTGIEMFGCWPGHDALSNDPSLPKDEAAFISSVRSIHFDGSIPLLLRYTNLTDLAVTDTAVNIGVTYLLI
jgi:hypothetical protein